MKRIAMLALAWACLMVSSFCQASCMAPYGSYYYGYVTSADGSTVLADVRIREARASRNASSRLTLTITDRTTHAVRRFVARACRIPSSFVAYEESIVPGLPGERISGLANRTYIVANWGDRILIASTKGADDAKNANFTALDLMNGYWTFALRPTPVVGSESWTGTPFTQGDIACSLNIQARNRKYKLTVMMPDGWKWTASGKLGETETAYLITASKSRKSKGGVESFGFTIAIDKGDLEFSAVKMDPWVQSGGAYPFETRVGLLDAGYPIVSKADFKKCSLTPCDPVFLIRSKTLNAKSGVVGGTAKISVVDANGRVKLKTAKVWGVDVSGTCYGASWLKQVASTPLDFAAPADAPVYE